MEPDLRDPLTLARTCAAILDEKKIEDLEIFDVGSSFTITSYFVIGTGLNSRHIKSVVDHLERYLKERGLKRRGLEGYREGKWVLFDLGDIVVHLFLSEARGFYDLDLLWGDSPRIDPELPAVPRQAVP
jgi:ribosome-associated protein